MYMAPEVAKGAAVSASADVYSVGCLLYHLFSGKTRLKALALLILPTNMLTITA